MIPATQIRYSVEWSRNIVRRLYEKYPRATDFVCDLLEIKLMELAAFLAHGDPIYPKIRDAIHWADNWERSPNFGGWNYTNVKQFGGLICRRMPGRMSIRVDKVKFWDRIKEQESREGSRTCEAPAGT